MKAITITIEIKNYNADLFKNFAVGSIKTFTTIPKTFSGISKNWQRTDMYQTLDNSIHEADGFYDVVTPAFDSAIEKLGAIFFNVTEFTYPIVALTQPEIDAIATKAAKDEFKNNLTGVYMYAFAPDGKEWALKIGNDGKTVSVLVP